MNTISDIWLMFLYSSCIELTQILITDEIITLDFAPLTPCEWTLQQLLVSALSEIKHVLKTIYLRGLTDFARVVINLAVYLLKFFTILSSGSI